MSLSTDTSISFQNVTNNNQLHNKPQIEKSGCLKGREYFSCLAKQVGKKIYDTTHLTLRSFSWIASDANALASVGRKFDKQVVRSLEYMMRMPGCLCKLQGSVNHAVGLIDSAQVLADVHYFNTKQYLNDRIYGVASKVFFTVADVTGAMLWLQEMHFFNLGQISVAISNIRVFSFVPKAAAATSRLFGINSLRLAGVAAYVGEIRIFKFVKGVSIGFISCRALTLAYILAAADSVHRLMVTETRTEKTQAALDLAAYLSELVLDGLMTFGVANLTVVGGAGVVAICLVAASFVYRKQHPVAKLIAQPQDQVKTISSKVG